MLEVQQLNGKKHDRKRFDCGVESLNDYLVTQAASAGKKGISSTNVLVDTDNPERIIGYYTLCYCTVKAPPSEVRLKKYPHPVAALRLARLAVDKDYHGNRFGEQIIAYIFQQIAKSEINALAPILGLFVDAKEDAVGFYLKLGFLEVGKNGSYHEMYTPIGTIVSG